MTDLLHQDAADLAEDARRLLRRARSRRARARPRSPPSAGRRSTSSRRATPSKSSSTCPACRRESLRVAIRRNTLLVVGAKLAPAGRSARAVSSRRAQLRPLRARRPAGRRGRRAAARAPSRRAASCASCCRASTIAAARCFAFPWSAHDAPALHRRHRRQAGARARAPRPAARSSRITTSISSSPTCENAAAGFGITPDIADDLLRLRRPRDDGRQSHAGTRRRSCRTSPSSRGCCARRICRRARRAAAAYVARATNGVPVARHQRHGPRVHDGDRRSVPRRARRDRRRRAARRAIVFVDFHAEATSEKVAMGWHLDGRVTAVVGTHTHVQTADERVLPQGTAYITDVGMTGPHDSVIGVERSAILQRFLTGAAAALRDRDGEPAAERRHRRRPTRRPGARRRIERLSLSAQRHRGAGRAAGAARADDGRLAATCRSTTTPRPARRPLVGQRAHRAA